MRTLAGLSPLNDWIDAKKLGVSVKPPPDRSTSAHAADDDWDFELEGYYRVRGGTEYAIARGRAFAPHADVVWMETAKPDLAQADAFATGMRAALDAWDQAASRLAAHQAREALDALDAADGLLPRPSPPPSHHALGSAARAEEGGQCTARCQSLLKAETFVRAPGGPPPRSPRGGQ